MTCLFVDCVEMLRREEGMERIVEHTGCKGLLTRGNEGCTLMLNRQSKKDRQTKERGQSEQTAWECVPMND